MSWSNKYKRSINCDNPSGFSQKSHCAARKKRAKGEETKSKSPFSEMNEEKKKNRCKPGNYYCYTDKKCKPIPAGFMVDPEGMLRKENGASIDEEGLRDWFGKSKSKDGKSGWVNVVTGGTCASDEPGEGTPKCVSSAKRASMTKAERLSAARRKKAADPGQQAKTGAARPTYVSTDSPRKKRRKRKTRKEETDLVGLIEKKLCNHTKKGTYCPSHGNEECLTVSETRDHEYSMARSELSTIISAAKRLRKKMAKGEGNVEAWVQSKITKAADYIDTAADYVDSGEMNEESDRKGKGSGTKDACYHKVKSRYSVWPSAYASGALVKCRKVGAANWGNKSEAYVLSNWRDDFFPTEIETVNIIEPEPLKPSGSKGEQLDEFLFGPSTVTPKNSPTGTKSVKVDKPYPARQNGDPGDVTYDKSGNKKVTPRTASRAGLMQYKYGSTWGMPQYQSYEPEGEQLDEKCWPGYKKKGMKTMFGKRYPNCVKKEGFSNWRSELQISELLEDWQEKNRKDGVDGLSQSTVDAYRRENPGSKLQTAVTEKKPTGKRADRRKSFCRRMKGMKAKLTSAKTARDPDSRINKALRRWNCN